MSVNVAPRTVTPEPSNVQRDPGARNLRILARDLRRIARGPRRLARGPRRIVRGPYKHASRRIPRGAWIRAKFQRRASGSRRGLMASF